MVRPSARWFCLFSLVLVWGTVGASTLHAQSPAATSSRPDVTRLLPQHTVVLVQIPDATDFRARAEQGALFRMANDPEMRGLVEGMRGNINEAFTPVQEEIGASLPEILTIPRGEFAIAIVAPEERRPSLVMLIEAGDNLETVRKLLERGEKELAERGRERREETIENTTVTIYDVPRRELAFFEREGCFVLGTDVEVVRDVLKAWNGSAEGGRLADNVNFNSIMSHCRVDGEQSHLTWFVDPINLLHGIAVRSSSVRTGIALLPIIGLDGFLGVGGSVSLSTEQYEFLSRGYVLLETPRSGVLDLISLKAGDITPEPFVPADAATYTTVYWDMARTFQKLAILIDSFRGEGALERDAQRAIGDALGADFQKDVLPLLDDRLVLFTWIERPVTIRSGSSAIAVRVKDPGKAAAMLEKLADDNSQRVSKKSHGGQTYYEWAPEDEKEAEPGQPRPCMGILGSYVVIADRPSLYQQCIAAQADTTDSLAKQVDFKLIASKLNRIANGRPGMITFLQPEESLRWAYEMVNSETTRDGLNAAAEDNPFLAGVRDTMEKNPLPPFSVLQQYLAPGGRVIAQEGTGYAYTAFTLRRKK